MERLEDLKKKLGNLENTMENFIPEILLINFLELPQEEYEEILNSDGIKEIYGFPKEQFIAETIKFVQLINLAEEYDVSETVKNRIKDLCEYKAVNMEYPVCNYDQKQEKDLSSFEINPSLEQAILGDMPDSLNDLEKAIYIYIKLCKTLQYDDEYYVLDQYEKDELPQIHHRRSNVSKITPENNVVTCYELSTIYAKMLQKLEKIKFKIDTSCYGIVHMDVGINYDKVIAVADCTIPDLMGAKMNLPILGLRSRNTNQESQSEFDEAVKKVYGIIMQQERMTEGETNNKSFKNALQQYRHLIDRPPILTVKDKARILIQKANDTDKVQTIEKLSYIRYLRKILFSEAEKRDNIHMMHIRNNKPPYQGKDKSAALIITINLSNMHEYPGDNIYAIYNPGQELEIISRAELKRSLASMELEYIEEEGTRIPGLDYSGEQVGDNNGGIEINDD